MSAITIRAYAWKPAHGLQWCRNGRYPDARLQEFIADEGNHLALVRVKELASFCCPIQSIPAGEADGNPRPRWRFHFHASPFARYVWFQFVLAKNSNAYSPGAQLLIETTAPATFGSGDWRYGDSATTAVDVPDHFGTGKMTLVSSGVALAITPDTDFLGTFNELGSGRLVAANAYEWGLQPDTDNGYVPASYASGSPIYDEDRYDLASMARSLWKRQAAHLWNWSSETDDTSPTTTSTTAKNVIDNSSTTVSGATPGATIDLTNRGRVSQATVPCRFAVYGHCTQNVNGVVELKDSSGTVLATCSGFTSSGTGGWLTTTVNLPASVAKYDVHMSTNLGVFTVRAFSLYQHLA